MSLQLALSCLAMWVFVGLKSFQQRNVAFDHLKWIVPTSIGMSFCEFYVIAFIAVDGFSVLKALALGVAAGTGSLAATVLHGRFLGGANGKRMSGGVSTATLAQGLTEARGASDEGPTEEDGPWAEGWEERSEDQSEEGDSGVAVSRARAKARIRKARAERRGGSR